MCATQNINLYVRKKQTNCGTPKITKNMGFSVFALICFYISLFTFLNSCWDNRCYRIHNYLHFLRVSYNEMMYSMYTNLSFLRQRLYLFLFFILILLLIGIDTGLFNNYVVQYKHIFSQGTVFFYSEAFYSWV